MDINTIINNFVKVCKDFHSIASERNEEKPENEETSAITNIGTQLISLIKVIYEIDNSNNINSIQKKLVQVFNNMTSKDTTPIHDEIIQFFDYILQQEKKYLLSHKGEDSNRQTLGKKIKKVPTKILRTPTTLASWDIFQRSISSQMIANNETHEIDVSQRKTKRKKVITFLSINMDNLKQLGVSMQYLTPYDREIHDAICSLIFAGNEWISYGEIFQVLNGNKGGSMSPQMKEKIAESIQKLSFTEVTINAKAEVDADLLPENSGNTGINGTYKGYLIPAERMDIEINGQTIADSIHLLRVPPLFNYARDKNQIASINVEILDTPLSNTPENIELKGYMLRRILRLKNKKSNKKNANIIRYDTLYQYLDIDTTDTNALRLKRLKIRRKVQTLLNYWIEKNFLQSYTVETESGAIEKIILYV